MIVIETIPQGSAHWKASVTERLTVEDRPNIHRSKALDKKSRSTTSSPTFACSVLISAS